MTNEKAEKQKNQTEDLKKALKRIIPQRDKLLNDLQQERTTHVKTQQALNQERTDHQKTKEELDEVKKDLEGEDTPEVLWDELETYFLVRSLTEKDIKRVYGDKDFKDTIFNKTTAEDLKTGTSKKIFQTVVNIVAANKILQFSGDAEEVIEDLQDIEKELNVLLPIIKEKEENDLYLKEEINGSSDLLKKIQEEINKNKTETEKVQATISNS